MNRPESGRAPDAPMVTIVLPAYNEADALAPLLERIGDTMSDRPYRVFLVDDGSTDATVEIARGFAGEIPLTVEEHEVNRGLGRALLTGIRGGTPGSDIVVTMDADNTHDPALIPAMLDRLAEGYDVVIASRFAETGAEKGVPAHRRVLSHGVGALLHALLPVSGVRDYSCGYRAYRSEILEEALKVYGPDDLVRESGFACMVELLLKLARLDARFDEVPLVLRYDLKSGESKMRVGRTIGRYLGLIRSNLPLVYRLNLQRFR